MASSVLIDSRTTVWCGYDGRDLRREITESGERALEAARAATLLRNGIVHDLWLLESESNDEMGARWNTFGASRGRTGTVTGPGPGGKETVEAARAALDRAVVRVSGLFMALHEVLPRFEESPNRSESVSGLPTYVALMDGDFRLTRNGDWELDSPS